MLDEATKNCSFGYHARVLVDINLSQLFFGEIMMEQEGYVFYMEIVYEMLP